MSIAATIHEALKQSEANLDAPDTWSPTHLETVIVALGAIGVKVKPAKASIMDGNLTLTEWEFSWSRKPGELPLALRTNGDAIHFASCNFAQSLVD